MSDQTEQLCRKLGYHFQDTVLLNEALCHRSYGGKSNERLEFLGDSILNFVIAAEIFERHPERSEGELSRLRANLVMGETLSELGKELDLGRFLLLGSGERKSGGTQRKSILADAVEAIIGAIYLDRGFEACQQKILDWFQSRLVDEPKFNGLKDAKTQLQEFLQARKLALPSYNVVNVEGEDHAQLFVIECAVSGFKVTSEGQGTSRRKAEQAAALAFLSLLEEDEMFSK